MSQNLGSAASSTGTSAKGKTGPKASPVWTDCKHCNAHICFDYQSWSMTANIIRFSLLDLKTASGAPEQEVTLHTTFGKNAKRLEHLSANTPRWIIE